MGLGLLFIKGRDRLAMILEVDEVEHRPARYV